MLMATYRLSVTHSSLGNNLDYEEVWRKLFISEIVVVSVPWRSLRQDWMRGYRLMKFEIYIEEWHEKRRKLDKCWRYRTGHFLYPNTSHHIYSTDSHHILGFVIFVKSRVFDLLVSKCVSTGIRTYGHTFMPIMYGVLNRCECEYARILWGLNS